MLVSLVHIYIQASAHNTNPIYTSLENILVLRFFSIFSFRNHSFTNNDQQSTFRNDIRLSTFAHFFFTRQLYSSMNQQKKKNRKISNSFFSFFEKKTASQLGESHIQIRLCTLFYRYSTIYTSLSYIFGYRCVTP